jgi:hypothetical protein
LTGSLINQWNDISGNDNHAIGTLTSRPTWDAVNGEVDFDGTDDYLIADPFSYAQPSMIYAVISVHGYTASDYLFKLGSNSFRQSATEPTALTIIGGGETFATGASFYNDDTYYILRIIYNEDALNGSKIQLNANSAVVGTLATSTYAKFVIGDDNATNGAYISVKEVWVRTKIDSGSDQTLVVNYLNSKYTVY